MGRIRNTSKFKRYAAAKQGLRTKLLRTDCHPETSASTADCWSGSGSDESGLRTPTTESCSCFDGLGLGTSPTLERQHNVPPPDPSGWYTSRSNSEESPRASVLADLASSPVEIDTTAQQCNSPVSVMIELEFDPKLLLHEGSSDDTKSATLDDKDVVRKQSFNFIGVESNNGNPTKGIIQHYSKAASGERKKQKKLTWWDDELNIHKPFMLKTDVIPLDWDDDESSIWEDHLPSLILPQCTCFSGATW